MDEFSLIEKYFKRTVSDPCVVLGIGDDAAVIRLDAADDLVVSTDSLVDTVHFLMEWPPECIARRALNVNVSDIVAMGATPRWVSLAITMPEINVDWLERFSDSFHQLLRQYTMHLIGGDTTQGPWSVTITVHGVVPRNHAVSRKGACAEDIIYVSGPLGAAALAVHRLKDGLECSSPEDKALLQALQDPSPRVDLIETLRSFASSAIDISDGLAADLEHICQQSACGAVVNLPDIPVHPLVLQKKGEAALSIALTGGDDYEICFTVPHSRQIAFENHCRENGIRVYRIGRIQKEPGMCFMNAEKQTVNVDKKGYQHFT